MNTFNRSKSFKGGFAATVASAALLGAVCIAAPTFAASGGGAVTGTSTGTSTTSSTSPSAPGAAPEGSNSTSAGTPMETQTPPDTMGSTGSSTAPAAGSTQTGAAGSPSTTTARRAEHRDARTEAHIKALRTQLHITKAQEPAWDNLAQVMRDNEDEMNSAIAQRAQKPSTMSALDDLNAYAAISDARADGMKKLVPAFSSLYGQLSPTQKKEADSLFAQARRSHAAHASSTTSSHKSPTQSHT